MLEAINAWNIGRMKTANGAQLELNGVAVETDVGLAVVRAVDPEIKKSAEGRWGHRPLPTGNGSSAAKRMGTPKKNSVSNAIDQGNDFPIMPDGERLLRIHEVAGLLRMSDKTVRRMITAGQLTSKKIRGLRLIRWSDLSNLLNQTA